jgi:hypothetical protein
MTLWADCPQRPSAQNLLNIKQAMFHAGFDVIDRVQFAEEQHVDYPFVLQVDAIDKVGHEISISTTQMKDIPQPASSTAFEIDVALYSKPPTHHDAKLEQSVREWMTSGLGCSEVKFERHNNRPDAAPTYSLTSGYTRDWIKQARDLHASTNALLSR